MYCPNFIQILEKLDNSKEYTDAFLVSLGLDTFLKEYLYLIHENRNFFNNYFKNGRLTALFKISRWDKGEVTIDNHVFDIANNSEEIKAILSILKKLQSNLTLFLRTGINIGKSHKLNKLIKKLGFSAIANKQISKKQNLLNPFIHHCKTCLDILDILINQINSQKNVFPKKIRFEPMYTKIFDYEYNEKLVYEIRYSIFKDAELIKSNEYKLLTNFIELGMGLSNFICNKNQYSQRLRNGDILLSYHLPKFLKRHRISSIIGKYTNSCCTHAGIYFEGKVVEANFEEKHGINLEDGFVRDRELYDDKDDLILVLRPKFSFDIKAMQKLFSEHTKPRGNNYKYTYDIKELIGFAIYISTGWFPRFLKNNSAFFCSEYVNHVYAELGHVITKYGYESQYVSPKDILESQALDFVCIVDGTQKLSEELSELTKERDVSRLQTEFRRILRGELRYRV